MYAGKERVPPSCLSPGASLRVVKRGKAPSRVIGSNCLMTAWLSTTASCTVQPKRVGLLSLETKVGKRSLGWVGRAPISLDGAVPTARSGPPSGEK